MILHRWWETSAELSVFLSDSPSSRFGKSLRTSSFLLRVQILYSFILYCFSLVAIAVKTEVISYYLGFPGFGRNRESLAVSYSILSCVHLRSSKIL